MSFGRIGFGFLFLLLLSCPLVTRANKEKTQSMGKVVRDVQAYQRAIKQMKQTFAKLPEKPKVVSWVQKKLAHMVKLDQYTRSYPSIIQKHHYNSQQTMYFWKVFGKHWKKVDQDNTKELQRLLLIHKPWFLKSKFGDIAQQDAWILIQHADHNRPFQKKMLKVLESLVKQGETNPKNFAYLYDRIAVFGDVRVQRFGTQGLCTGKGTWEPLPVENPDALDARRKSVGLKPIAVYIKSFRTICTEANKASRSMNQATLQRLFYFLHQSVGHLESWQLMRLSKKNKCIDSFARSKAFMAKALVLVKKHFMNPLLHHVMILNGQLHSPSQVNITVLESLRMKHHLIAIKLKLSHKREWHQAFLSCRK